MRSLLLALALCLTSFVANAKTKVIYFHGKQRCATCLSIEKNAKDLVEERYAEELRNGQLEFMVVDFSTPLGKSIAEKYKVTFSSLIVENEKGKTDVTCYGFQYARTQPDQFKSELKDVVDKALAE